MEALALGLPGAITDTRGVIQALLKRELEMSTAFGLGVAVPHCFLRGFGPTRLAVATSAAGIDFGAMDGELTHVVFLLLEDLDARGAHTEILSRIARLCHDTDLLEELRTADDPAAIPGILARAESRLG